MITATIIEWGNETIVMMLLIHAFALTEDVSRSVRRWEKSNVRGESSSNSCSLQ
jgi:hypothetical protein